jgi:nucleotide-binding universal stress UspA family protein
MKPIQSILVHLDAGPHGASRLQVARRLGGQFGAAVTALYAVTPLHIELSVELAAAGTSNALLALDQERLADARKLLADAGAEPGAPIEWGEARDAPEASFIRQALYADLLVLGQHDREHRDTGVLPDFVQSVVIASGKPALVVPYIGARASNFDTVLIAWKEAREAARAVTAALPILGAARAVHVGLDAGMPDGHQALLQRFLHRHGVQAQFHTLADDTAQAGNTMLSMAADLGADLMVMGCFGHTRARELVLGGASRTVLGSMTLPVLLAH